MPDHNIAFRYGRVWVAESAYQAKFTPSHFYEDALEANDSSIEVCSVCLRLSLPGFASSFGLLGCQFNPADNGKTEIKVGVLNDPGNTSLKTGLADELAGVVLSQTMSALEHNNFLGSGTLYFDRAMYHEVDSNRFIFRMLTTALLTMLDPQQKLATGEDMVNLINKLIIQMRK